ncbi:MAG: hypothetical protein L3J41_03340 [Melioribacteraceae bacterium]|nr:hypothetical protein [Melioribacteraceae bacterium]
MKSESPIDFTTLLKKYKTLVKENQTLQSENKKLKIKLGLIEHEIEKVCKASFGKITSHTSNQITSVNKNSSTTTKLKLFTSLFKGRTDVYAKKWVSIKLNEWRQGICKKPQIKCSQYNHKLYDVLNDREIEGIKTITFEVKTYSSFSHSRGFKGLE